MNAPSHAARASMMRSRTLAIAALVVSLVGGMLLASGSVLAVVIAVAAVIEGRLTPGYRARLAWASLALSTAAAAFWAFILYRFFWREYHHPGGGGPIPQPDGFLWACAGVSLGLGVVGLLKLFIWPKRRRLRSTRSN